MTIILPQRIATTARPGELLKRPLTLEPAIRTPESAIDRAYLDDVRQCPCLHCGQDPCYEAAHLRMASAAHGKASGAGKRPDDKWALPVCPEHHRLAQKAQHVIGERAFWESIGISPLLVAERLYAKRGDLVAMRAVIFNAIAEREAVSQFRGIGRVAKVPT